MLGCFIDGRSGTMSIESRARSIWHSSPRIFRLQTQMARLRGATPLKMLLVSDQREFTSEQQFAPILRHARLLKRKRGVILQAVDQNMASSMSEKAFSSFDIVGFKLSFRTPKDEALRIATYFKRRTTGSNARLVYFDGDDDSSIQWPELLDLVDLYVKKHTFSDWSDYSKIYIGKNNLTDFAARHFGVSFADDIIPSSGGIPVGKLDRLYLGWNIALDEKIHHISKNAAGAHAIEKDIDITCRAYVAPSVWTHGLRVSAAERLEGLAGRFRVQSPRQRVSQAEYNAEMSRSRICVSPFGFGEICWRDFEAIAMGCLLVKPDMSHIRTAPNLFVPGETYIPVRWDFSDLEEVCAYYLAHEKERLAITHRATQRLLEASQPDWFIACFDGLLAALGRGQRSNAAATPEQAGARLAPVDG